MYYSLLNCGILQGFPALRKNRNSTGEKLRWFFTCEIFLKGLPSLEKLPVRRVQVVVFKKINKFWFIPNFTKANLLMTCLWFTKFIWLSLSCLFRVMAHWFGRLSRKNFLPAFKHCVANNQALTLFFSLVSLNGSNQHTKAITPWLWAAFQDLS